MLRLLFEKTGNAVWISHLDLMRLFQRAFKRANLPLKHTQGYNPRPSVSIALPLSVGVESKCELLDFDLDGESVNCEDICSRLNRYLVKGVKVLGVYDAGMKIRDLAYLRCAITLEYDAGVPDDTEFNITELFAREALVVTKSTKNGVKEIDVIPMIRSIHVHREGDNQIQIEAVICCQNPTLNPVQLVQAICEYLPQYSPDFSKCCRIEIYNKNDEKFR